MNNTTTYIEDIIKQQLYDISQTRKLFMSGKQQQVIHKLVDMESSLRTALAMEQMQTQECEHIDYSQFALPVAK